MYQKYFSSAIKSTFLLHIFFCFPTLISGQIIDSLSVISGIGKLLVLDSILSPRSDISGVSTFQTVDLRNSPGHILVISDKEIAAMQGEDIIDVINQISGTILGRDVEDAIGLGVRGLWAQEGKIQFMLNEVPINDLDYGTFNLFNRIPLGFVSRIEISFGPRSEKFGGTAALGVINIITKSNISYSKIALKSLTSFAGVRNSHSGIYLFGNSPVNDRFYIDFDVSSISSLKTTYDQPIQKNQFISWSDSSLVRANNFHIGLHGTSIQSNLYFSNYTFEVSESPNIVIQNQFSFDNKVNRRINENTVFKTQLYYISQLPWFDANTQDLSLINTNTRSNKICINHLFSSRIFNLINLDYGLQGFYQTSKIYNKNSKFQFNNSNEIRIADVSVFSDVNLKSRFGNVGCSGRIETNTNFPISAAPRIYYNKQFNRIYFKLFLANSYKIPTISNINYSLGKDKLRPELVVSKEMIFGYSHASGKLELNIYQTEINFPIVYISDSLAVDAYINSGHIGTQGVEFSNYYQNRILTNRISAFIYQRTKLSEGNVINSSYPGMPAFKITSYFMVKIKDIVNMHTNFIYTSKSISNTVKMNAENIMINLGVSSQKYLFKHIEWAIKVQNLFNQPFNVYSVNSNTEFPIPMFQRQISCSLQYTF
jgi:outer membrane receptor protein involved in Fe transport